MADSPSTHSLDSPTEKSAASLAGASPAGSSATDHLQHLKKMSTTAGLGSGDYAAISPIAVAALVTGVLGALAFLSDFLLVLPAAAIVCGIIALVQIRRSNGTQTGLPLAWAGIVFGVAVLGVVIGSRIMLEMRNRPVQQAVVGLITQLDEACAKRDYHAAYQLFSAAFRQRVDEERFTRTFSGGEGMLDRFGSVQHVRWNEQIIYHESPEGGLKAVSVGAMFKFEHYPDYVQQQMDFTETNGKWEIHDVAAIFPRPQQGQPSR